MSVKHRPLLETVAAGMRSEVAAFFQLKFGYSEKATKFKKIFHLEFDVTEWHQILRGRFFQILWPSQNIRTLPLHI